MHWSGPLFGSAFPFRDALSSWASAKDLSKLKLRFFASLRMTLCSLRMTLCSLRMTLHIRLIKWYKRQKSKWRLNLFKKPFDFGRQTTWKNVRWTFFGHVLMRWAHQCPVASSNLRSKLADCECCRIARVAESNGAIRCIKTVIQYFWRPNH